MPKKRKAPANIYQELLEVAQRLVRANDPKPRPESKAKPQAAKARRVVTAVAAVSARVAEADDALHGDLVDLARRVLDATNKARSDLQSHLESLKGERCDYERRRRELAASAETYDWTMVHKDKLDFIGPFTLEHAAERSRILLGRIGLRALEYPSGPEVFDAVVQERLRFEHDARSLWPKMKDSLLPLQQSKGGSMTWREVIAGLAAGGASGKRNETVALFAIVMLRQGVLEAQWSLSTRPPALAQQREAILVPRMDKPGSPDKVFALRIEGPGVQA